MTSTGGPRRRDLGRPGPAGVEGPSVREDVPLHPAQVHAEATSSAGESGDQADAAER